MKHLNKKWTFTLIIVLYSCVNHTYASSPSDSTKPWIPDIPVWKLIPTQNRWMFLKLNTKTGQIHEVQYSMEDETRFDQLHSFGVIKDSELKGDEPTNRFDLVPTKNIYTFLLVDQIYGDVWQIQWGKNRAKVKIMSAVDKEINRLLQELKIPSPGKEE